MLTTQSKQQTLAKVCKDLMLKSPFYGICLLMLDKKFSSSIPTACVRKLGINYQLMFGEEFWENLTHNWRIGIVKHELLHICFFHLLRHEEFQDHDVANWAMDMEINQYIEKEFLPEKDMTKEQFKAKYDPMIQEFIDKYKAGEMTKEECRKAMNTIPPRGVYLDDYPEMKLEPRKGTQYYYDKMMEAKEEKQKSAQNGGVSASGGAGTCGCPSADSMLEQMDQNMPMIFDHDWEAFEGLSESEKKLLKTQIDFHLKEIAQSIKSRGTVPGEMQGYIDSLFVIQKPKFDWKSYVRRFSGGSTQIYTKKLQRKNNRRFEEYAGLKIKQKRHVLVGVDTSGSVSDNELKEFLQEFHHILNTGTEVTIAQFDYSLQNVAKFKKREQFKVHGRGGTSFDAIVDYANEHHRKYTALIVFTDGEAPAPVSKSKLKTLWVHSSQSNINESLPGFRIKLEL